MLCYDKTIKSKEVFILKKIICCLILAAVLMSLAACSGTTSDTDSKANETTVENTFTPDPLVEQAIDSVKKEWIKPGAVIIGVSAFDMDPNELKTCSLVVDNIKLYEAWAEEFTYPSFGANNIIGSKFTDMVHDKIIKRKDICDLGDIIYGKRPGRVSDDQIFVFSVGGMPVEDVAWGKICYEKAKLLGIGTKLTLWDEPVLR